MPLPTIAIVLPAFNETESVSYATDTLTRILEGLIQSNKINRESFLLFVDDGSKDDTWSILTDLSLQNNHLRGLKLSRNFGHQSALLAGLTEVTGNCDAAISMDADLQQDPEAIPDFIEAYLAGGDVVLGIRKDRSTDNPLKKLSALFFYRLMEVMGVHIEKNHADYRLLSSRALETLKNYQETDVFLRAVCLDMGFTVKKLYFSVDERRFGGTKYSLRKMLSFSLSGITAFSTVPLRMVAFVGLIVFLGSLGMTSYIIWIALVMEKAVPGWASTTLPIYFMGGIQLLCLGIVGEYIGRVYATVKNRPRWICESRII